MHITIKYFASIRESMGTASEAITTHATTLAALRDELVARGGPAAEVLSRERPVRVALNQTMAEESAALVEDAEVAFFPPVTGG